MKENFKKIAPLLNKWRTSYQLKYIEEFPFDISTLLYYAYKKGWVERKPANSISFNTKVIGAKWAYKIKKK